MFTPKLKKLFKKWIHIEIENINENWKNWLKHCKYLEQNP